MGGQGFLRRFAAAGRPGRLPPHPGRGRLAAGDPVEVVHRPGHGLTVAEVSRIYHDDHAAAARLLEVPELADTWKQLGGAVRHASPGAAPDGLAAGRWRRPGHRVPDRPESGMSQQANLRVQVLGVLAVAVDGREVPATELASRKGRTLLKLLLARRGSVVPAEVAGRGPVGRAAARRPRRQPGHAGQPAAGRARAGRGRRRPPGWRFVAGARVEVDLDEAERLAGEAEARLAGEPALALAAAERALALLGRGPFLADEPDADWAMAPRREAERLTARSQAAGLGRRPGRRRPCPRPGPRPRRHHRRPPGRAAWRAVMLAHTAAGEPAAALAAYEHLRQTLAYELGTDPAPDTPSLHLAGPPRRTGAGGERRRRGPHPRSGTEAAGAMGACRPAAGALGWPTPLAPATRRPWYVGREGEVAELAAAWKGAVGGRPGMVLVVGEAGIGKTRLVQAVAGLAGATGGLVVQARCYEAERSLFLQPVAEAVRAVALALPPGRVGAAAGDAAGTLAELVPDLRKLLDLPAYERAPAELQRRRSFEAVAGFVRGLAAQQPLLLVVDDLDLAGASTLELLHFLLRRLARRPVRRRPQSGPRRGPRSWPGWPTPGGSWSWASGGGRGRAGPPLRRGRPGRPGAGAGQKPHPVHGGKPAGGRRGQVGPGRDPASLRDAVQAPGRRAGPEVETLLRAAVVAGAASTWRPWPASSAAGRGSGRGAERALAARCRSRTRPATVGVRQRAGPRGPEPDQPPADRVTRHRRLAGGRPTGPRRPPAGRRRRRLGGRGHGLDGGGRQRRRVVGHPRRRAAARPGRRRGRQAGDPALEASARLDRGRGLVALGGYPAAFADQERALELAVEHGLEDGWRPALEELGWTPTNRDYGRLRAGPSGPGAGRAGRGGPPGRAEALLLAARMRNAEGDLAGAWAAFDARLGEPDPATPDGRPGLPGPAPGARRPVRRGPAVLDRSVEACRAAGPFRPMLTSFPRPSWPAPTWATCGGAGPAGAAGAVAGRGRGPLYHPGGHRRVLARRELGELGRALGTWPTGAAQLLGLATTGTHPGLHAQLALAERAPWSPATTPEPPACCGGPAASSTGPFGYRWRVELRHAELTSLLAGVLAAGAAGGWPGPYGSTKYQALALALLGRRPEAAGRVAATRLRLPARRGCLAAAGPGGRRPHRWRERFRPKLWPGFLERGRLAAATVVDSASAAASRAAACRAPALGLTREGSRRGGRRRRRRPCGGRWPGPRPGRRRRRWPGGSRRRRPRPARGGRCRPRPRRCRARRRRGAPRYGLLAVPTCSSSWSTRTPPAVRSAPARRATTSMIAARVWVGAAGAAKR